MKKLLFPLGLFSLMFCAGCGSNGPGPIIPKGNFSNASLKGQYVYQLSGTDTLNGVNSFPYYEAGVFVADGNGNLTNASDDFSEAATPALTTSTGSYSIKNDGTGTLTLNNASALVTVTLAVTMVSTSKAYLIEADAGLNSSGVAELQDTTVASSAPSGMFAFRLHTAGTSQAFGLSAASVGVFTASGGTVSNGTMDVDRGGTFNNGTASPVTFTGSFNAPPTLGRGTGTFTDSSNTTISFIYYIVDANNVRFLSSSSGLLGIGRAEKQSSPALSGSYAFGGRGDTVNNGINAVDTVGAFSASGGSITSGAIDAVEDGSNLSTTITGGTYTTTANGRVTVTLNAGTGPVQATFWMVNPSRGFFLITDDSNAVEDGTLDLQSGTFTNATMNGQFAFMMDGFDTTQLLDRLGTLTWDGTSKLTLNEVANSTLNNAGAISPGVLTGSYSVSSNGRAVGTINNLSVTNNDLVFYLISGSDAYILQNDTGVQINGMISLQH
jgi:hypothetical protein